MERSRAIAIWTFTIFHMIGKYFYLFIKMLFFNLKTKIRQNCSIQLFIYQGYPFVEVVGMQVMNDSGWLSDNSNWEYFDYSTVSFDGHGAGAYYYYWFRLKRRYQYFIINLFLPGYILVALQVSVFLIPPDAPDRSAFAATIMLAMFVLHSQILSYLPQTPRPIVAAYTAIACIIYGTVCTIYSGVICQLSSWKGMQRKISICGCKKMPYYHVIDKLAFLILLICAICLIFVPMCMISS